MNLKGSLMFAGQAAPVRFVVATIFATVVCFVACDSSKSGSTQSKTGLDIGTVSVEIDYNSRARNQTFDVPCSADSTVYSILERAVNLSEIKMDSVGDGPTAFVKSIGGVENEKAAGDNWVFRVNGKLGDRGSGDFPVSPGDKILWRFGKYPD